MKQKVTLDLIKETGEKFSVDFYSVNKIDEYINTLQIMRAELERKIEMKKQRKNRKRKQRECVKPEGLFAKSIKDALNGIFIKPDDVAKDDILQMSAKRHNSKDLSVEEEARNYKALVDSYNELPLDVKRLLSPLYEKVKNIHNEFVNSHKK